MKPSGFSPVSIILFSALLATAGNWVKNQTLSPKIVIGGATLAIFTAILEDAQPRLAQPLAYLILVGTFSAYGEQLFTGIADAVGSTSTIQQRLQKRAAG